MKVKLHWALLFALALPSFVAGAEEDAKNAARVKWAKGILADFWDLARSQDWRQIEGLMSPDLARGFPKTEKTWVSFASEANDILPKYDSYKVTSGEIDPDGGEVVFTGELVGKEKKADFKARIAREGAGGKWGIRYFVVKELEEPVKPKPK
jgi:hypothetical protein